MQNKLSLKKPKENRNEKWENSIEGILYDLCTLGDTTIEDEQNKFIIAETLLKLPKRTREQVLDEVVFVLVTAQATLTKAYFFKTIRKDEFRKDSQGNYFVQIEQPLIFLNFNKRIKKEEKMDTIAHEIAHFILGRDSKTFSETLTKRSKINRGEKKADDLAEKWGFKRSYKTYRI